MKTIEFEVIKNDFQRQYEAKIEGEILTAEFSEQERKIFSYQINCSRHL